MSNQPLLDITLDEEQAKLLRDHIVIGDDDDDVAPIRLVTGDGHSGYGLYLAQAEYQEEGAVLLAPLAAPAPLAAAEPYAIELLEAFPGCGDMRGMEIWCSQVRQFLRTKAAPTGAVPAVAQGNGSDKANEWRKLAHQFDAQRMAATVHLRTLLAMPQAHAEAARAFLAATPAEQIASVAPVQSPAPALQVQADMVLVPKQDIDDARAVLSELYAKYQTKIGPFASQCQRINVAFGQALTASASRAVGAEEPAPAVAQGDGAAAGPSVWLYDFMDGATTVRNWATTNKSEAFAPGNFNQRGYVPAEN